MLRATAAVALLWTVLAAPAAANSFTWTASIAGSEPTMASSPGPSQLTPCGETPEDEPYAGPLRYDAYAVRNTGGAADCLIVTLGVDGPCTGRPDEHAGSVTYVGGFAPTAPEANVVAGLEFTFCYQSSPRDEPYEVAVPAGGTAIPVVTGRGPTNGR